MMLLIYFRYPMLGTGKTIDYHLAGLIVLYVSTVVSLFSMAQYMRSFLSAALAEARARRDRGPRRCDWRRPRRPGARRRRRGAFWLSTPAADEAAIARDLVGAQPLVDRSRHDARRSRPGSSRPGARRAAAWCARGRGGRPASRSPSVGCRTSSAAAWSAWRRARLTIRCSSFTSTMRSGCATRPARRRSSRATTRRRRAARRAAVARARRPSRRGLGALGGGRSRRRRSSTGWGGSSTTCRRATPIRSTCRGGCGRRCDGRAIRRSLAAALRARRAGAARRVHRRRERAAPAGAGIDPGQLARAVSLALDRRRGRDAPDQGDPPARRRTPPPIAPPPPSSRPPPRIAPSTS